MTRGVKNSLKMSRGLYDFWKSSCGPGVLLGQNGNCGGHTSSSAPSCHLSTSGAGVLLFDVGALFLMAVFTRLVVLFCLGTGGGHEGPGRSEATSSAGSDGVGVVFFVAVFTRLAVLFCLGTGGGHESEGTSSAGTSLGKRNQFQSVTKTTQQSSKKHKHIDY